MRAGFDLVVVLGPSNAGGTDTDGGPDELLVTVRKPDAGLFAACTDPEPSGQQPQVAQA